ncbi:hypothetical protein CEXT_737371 [Caerostris extrusa]|uniref:Uncharacterized protein n=1 Tax=Caerostris extrusa TaxID=172846 RepID=A0AAV4WRU8_CAEEX|nr:hypothetical protein CEXT_737371 [Caerostris extrusa]
MGETTKVMQGRIEEELRTELDKRDDHGLREFVSGVLASISSSIKPQRTLSVAISSQSAYCRHCFRSAAPNLKTLAPQSTFK